MVKKKREQINEKSEKRTSENWRISIGKHYYYYCVDHDSTIENTLKHGDK